MRLSKAEIQMVRSSLAMLSDALKKDLIEHPNREEESMLLIEDKIDMLGRVQYKFRSVWGRKVGEDETQG